MRVTDATLAVLATARLTRLVTTDELGERYIREPVERLIHAHSTDAGEPGWAWLANGLVCPFCVGQWIGTGVLASYPLWLRPGLARLAVQSLALNYVAGHLSAHMDGHGEED